MHDILITAEHVSIRAVLHDTPTAREILKILPLSETVHLWGEEIYFTIPLKAVLEPDAREDIEIGELGYWPAGPAFCIFFGATPASAGEKPRAYSPVTVIGRVLGDPTPLKTVVEGAKITVEAITDRREEHR